MKRNTIYIQLWIAFTLFMFTACNSPQTSVHSEDAQGQAMESNEVAENLFTEEKDSLMKVLDERSKLLKAKVNKAKADLVAAKDNTKTKLQKRVEAMEQQQRDLKERYDQVETATEETWNDIKLEIGRYINKMDTLDGDTER